MPSRAAFLLESYQCFANMSSILGYNDTADIYSAKATALESWVCFHVCLVHEVHMSDVIFNIYFPATLYLHLCQLSLCWIDTRRAVVY